MRPVEGQAEKRLRAIRVSASSLNVKFLVDIVKVQHVHCESPWRLEQQR